MCCYARLEDAPARLGLSVCMGVVVCLSSGCNEPLRLLGLPLDVQQCVEQTVIDGDPHDLHWDVELDRTRHYKRWERGESHLEATKRTTFILWVPNKRWRLTGAGFWTGKLVWQYDGEDSGTYRLVIRGTRDRMLRSLDEEGGSASSRAVMEELVRLGLLLPKALTVQEERHLERGGWTTAEIESWRKYGRVWPSEEYYFDKELTAKELTYVVDSIPHSYELRLESVRSYRTSTDELLREGGVRPLKRHLFDLQHQTVVGLSEEGRKRWNEGYRAAEDREANGDVEGAREEYLELWRLIPNKDGYDIGFIEKYCDFLFRHGSHRDLESFLGKAVEQFPRYPVLYFYAGRLAETRGMLENARYAYTRFLDLTDVYVTGMTDPPANNGERRALTRWYEYVRPDQLEEKREAAKRFMDDL